MKAILCRAYDGPQAIEFTELPAPAINHGQVRIAVHAAGMNFADLLTIQGKYQVKPPLPFVPGGEMAGAIMELGEGVSGLAVGQRVIALGSGALAEEAMVAAKDVIPLPDAMSFAEGAGFAVAYGTSHLALTRRAGLKAGEKLMVLGASGGVGLAAVEIGKAMGATVIACASSADKLAVAREHGADHLIDYSRENLRDRAKALGGVDVVYDAVGGEHFDTALRCLNWEGRMLVVGFASGTIPQIPANLALLKNISIVGIYWGAYRDHNPRALADSLAELAAWYRAGRLKPHVSMTVPLAQAAEAFAALAERKATGKIVVTVR